VGWDFDLDAHTNISSSNAVQKCKHLISFLANHAAEEINGHGGINARK
jgi:hypothetical protein